MNIIIVLFDEFETLDVFGPVEVFGRLKDHFKIHYLSQDGGVITSLQGTPIVTSGINCFLDNIDILFIPGGMGVRKEISNTDFLNQISKLGKSAKYILTVCTGSGLLAKTGLMDGKKATSNKRSFEWASSQSSRVEWIRKARWVTDGHMYTSSGVAAGIDMSLCFIKDTLGVDTAKQICQEIEYVWNEDPDNDPFAN